MNCNVAPVHEFADLTIAEAAFENKHTKNHSNCVMKEPYTARVQQYVLLVIIRTMIHI